MDIKEKIRQLPNSPGVYFLKGEDGEVLYIGKSSCLRKRVSSYFRPQRKARAERLKAMAEKIEAAGGKIYLKAPIEEILIENCNGWEVCTIGRNHSSGGFRCGLDGLVNQLGR